MGVITDPIADMLTRIRNANTANHPTVDIPASRMKLAVAEILKEEGFIRAYEQVAEGPQGTLRVTLKYGPEKEKVITGLRRISRPGLRVYTVARRDPARARRPGSGDHVDEQGHHVRQTRQARRLRRRGVSLRLVSW
jgi:small subunit ribosomal protein S8